MNNKKVLGIYVGPHPAYVKFIESIGAKKYKITSRVATHQNLFFKGLNLFKSIYSIPSGFDIYLSEGCYYYPAIRKHLKTINGKIIDLCSSPVFYKILTKQLGWFEGKILLELAKEVDGFICEGSYIQEVHRKLGINAPSCVVYTFVNNERYNIFINMKPNLNSKQIAIIATNDYFYKGVDILLESMKIVNESDPGITLDLVVNKNINLEKIKHLMTDNIKISYDVVNALSNTALYVHPARGDLFPVAPLEAMLTGIPAIVSNETGTKEVIQEVDDSYVVPLDAQMIAEKILEYFSLPLDKKNELSIKFRNAAKKFNEHEQVQRFKKEYENLLKSL
ncbi:MAG: hypothetical protein CVT89_00300 [Candidatus Altiarchaeales archaeon HGW-Altiarchaeales-2]|nr:MAG: hypothetical protein CVT89_00300 [Candidatus Altiarchaeales archaeon HGW-Altiarchaeales-2]